MGLWKGGGGEKFNVVSCGLNRAGQAWLYVMYVCRIHTPFRFPVYRLYSTCLERIETW